jgi:uncharacterized protein (TIGR02246 family)
MIKIKSLVAVAASALMVCFGSTIVCAQDSVSKVDIKTLIHKYELALNNGNVDKIMKLYAKDGVFMPSNKSTAIGSSQVRKAYQHVFSELDLFVTFHIDEIIVRNDLAIVRTFSDGEITLIKSNQTIKNNSRELFLMKREPQGWKIYRYIFNESNTQK